MAAPPPPPAVAASSGFIKGRGTSWRPAEIVDLLSIWGAEKVQQQLRRSHRNLECFAAISREMRRRGHKRTAQECRRKTKGLRLDYKRALDGGLQGGGGGGSAGGSKAACPYFEELHAILRGDPSVTPRRLGKTRRRPEELAEEEEAGPSAAAFALGSRDFFLDELSGLEDQPGHRDGQGGSSDAQGGDRDSPEGGAIDMDADEDMNCCHSPAEDLLFEAQVGDGIGEENSNLGGSSEREYDVGPPPASLEHSSTAFPTWPRSGLPAYQSPATRLAALRTKRKGYGPRELVERVIRHATTESRKAREAAQEMDQALLQQSAEELRRIERAEQECREHRERLVSIFERQTALLEALVSHLCGNSAPADPGATNRTRPQMGSPKRGLSPPCDPETAEHRRSASGGDVSFDVGIAHPATTPPQTSTLMETCQEPETAHKTQEFLSS